MNDALELLEHSFQVTDGRDGRQSRLAFLADYIFDFTTYDDEIGELFASKALEVCAAITDAKTFDYIENPDNYRWFLLMVNMPFFVGRLDWGTSIRGAWWSHGKDQTLESCGIWNDNEQVLSLAFADDEWPQFIRAMIAFGVPRSADSAPSPAAR